MQTLKTSLIKSIISGMSELIPKAAALIILAILIGRRASQNPKETSVVFAHDEIFWQPLWQLTKLSVGGRCLWMLIVVFCLPESYSFQAINTATKKSI